MKLKALRTKNKNQQGFAMVLALVIMTVMFIVAGSLSTTRQMWGFFSTKQLDKTGVELPARADSANWFRANRIQLWTTGLNSHNLFLPATNTSSVLYMQYFLGNPADPYDGQPFPPLLPSYPDYGTNRFTNSLPYLYSRGTNAVSSGPKGAFDPYWGFEGYGGDFGVVFKREMPENIRQIRSGRFDKFTTQLRAWMSIDSALLTYVAYRAMPMSAFTLCVLPTAGNTVAVPFGTNWITPQTNAYSYGGYSGTPLGMGRIYVDGAVDAQSNNFSVSLPMVATEGYQNMGNVTFNFPSVLGGGSINFNANPSVYLSQRYANYRGMLASSADTPQKLIHRYAQTNTPFYAKTIEDGLLNYYYNDNGSTAIRCQLNTSATNTTVEMYQYNPTLFDGGISSQVNNAISTNNPGMWAVNHTNRTVTLRPSANYFNSTNFSKAPTSIFFRFTGTQPNNYKLKVDVPSVGSLSSETSDRRALTVVTTNTMVLVNGFNADSSGSGAMVVAPRIEIESATAATIGGYVITSAGNPRNPFWPFDPGNPPPTPTIVGGLGVFQTLTGTAGTLRTTIVPSINYASGQLIPPSTPALLDYRVAQEDIQVYTIYATQTNNP